MNRPLASFTGGFSVGARVLRVRVLEKVKRSNLSTEPDCYMVEVTSRTGRGYTRGEQFKAEYRDLWDRHHFVQGPKCVSIGKTWAVKLKEQSHG